MRLHFYFVSLSLLLLLACHAPNSSVTVHSTNSTSNTQTLFGLYMIGSDLEDDVAPRNKRPDEVDTGKQSSRGAGSNDLRELVQAWRQMDANTRQKFDTLIAFGGARKQGWSGVKYATLSCLEQDAQDHYFGNASCYVYQDSSTNMSSRQALEHFLLALKDRQIKGSRLILDLWDHGAAYVGYGTDSNHRKRVLPISEWVQAFETSNIHIDLLAFDACLMGNLEVAQRLAPFTDYLVGSQELEPGHGWHYGDILTLLGRNDVLIDLAKAIVDSFVTHPDHRLTKNKTLGLLDLRQTSLVVKRLDELLNVLSLSDYRSLWEALHATESFGFQSRSGSAYTRDLYNWAENIALFQNGAALQARALQTALDSMVLYSRDDGSKKSARGVSFYSLEPDFKTYYGKEQALSDRFLVFTEDFLEKAAEPNPPPLIQPIQSAFQLQKEQHQIDGLLCPTSAGPALCFTLTGSQAPKAYQMLLVQLDDGTERILGEIPLVPSQQYQYQASLWKGKWFSLCETCFDHVLDHFVYFRYLSTDHEGQEIYLTESEVDGQPVDFYIRYDARHHQVTATWGAAFEYDEGLPISRRLDIDFSDDSLRHIRFRRATLKQDAQQPTIVYDWSPLIRIQGPLRLKSQTVSETLGKPIQRIRTQHGFERNFALSSPLPVDFAFVPRQNASAIPTASPSVISLPLPVLKLEPMQLQIKALPTHLYLNHHIKVLDQASLPVTEGIRWKSLSAGLEVVNQETSEIRIKSGKGPWKVAVHHGPSEQVLVLTLDLLSVGEKSGGNGHSSPQIKLMSISPEQLLKAGQSEVMLSLTGQFFPQNGLLVSLRHISTGVVYPIDQLEYVSNTLVRLRLNLSDATQFPTGRYDVLVQHGITRPAVLPHAFGLQREPMDVVWEEIGSGLSPLINRDLLTWGTSAPLRMYATQNNEVYQSDNAGLDWRAVPQPTGTAYQGLSVWGYRLWLGTQNTVSSSLDLIQAGNGSVWQPAGLGLPNFLQQNVFAVSGRDLQSILYLGANSADIQSGLFVKDTVSSAWRHLNTLPPGEILSLAGHSQNPDVLWVGMAETEGLWMTENRGETWQSRHHLLPSGDVIQLKSSPRNPLTLYALIEVLGAPQLYISYDGGLLWEPRSTGLPPHLRYLALDPTDENRAYVASPGNGLYQTIDGGLSWQAIHADLPNLTLHLLYAHPFLQNVLYVSLGDAGRLYRLRE